MDSRLIKPFPKPSLLKDYLLDDMSSCSSNGFKSFPRRQCCSSVRFLHEIDRKNKQFQHHQKQKINFNSNKPPTKSALSALQSVITAVKRLQFGASKSPGTKKSINSFLPRSFSKKILNSSNFWKRKDRKEIKRLKSFDQLLKEDLKPSDRSNSSITTADSKSNRWSESDFTVSTDGCPSGNSSTEVSSNLPESNDGVKVPMEVVSDNGVGATNGDVSTDSTTCSDGSANTNSKKEWSSGEKEQFSPVSVLDCPFDDEDDEVSSPFQHRLARMEGTKKKLLMKIQRFECLAKLEPVNLATRFALQPDSDNESSDSPLPHSSSSMDDKFASDIEEDEQELEDENGEQKALELLQQTKISTPSYPLNADKLLLDFFRERITTALSCDNELIEEAGEWINGRNSWFMEWEKQQNGQAYVEEMEKGEKWRASDEETEEVAVELGNEVYGALLNELLLDMFPLQS